jgi:hypothetical protein
MNNHATPPSTSIIVINSPKQRQNNIQHGSTKKLRLIVPIQRFDAAKDTARSALRCFKRKDGASWIGVGMALWRERLMYDRFGLWWLAGRGTPAGAGVGR